MRYLRTTVAVATIVSMAQAQQPESPVSCSLTQPIQIVYGQHTSGCSISPATNLDLFRFQGKAGDQVRLRVAGQSNDLDPRVDIYSPTNTKTPIASPSCSAPSWGTCTFQHAWTLKQTGTYTLVVSDNGNDNSGNYQLQLERIPPVIPVPGIKSGQTVKDVISPSTDIDYFVFNGVAKDLVQFAVQGLTNNLDPVLEIWDATTATTVASKSCSAPSWGTCTFNFSFNLPSTGRYYAIVYDSGADNTGSYNLSATCLLGTCPTTPKGLVGTPPQIVINDGGRQDFVLDAGSGHAGSVYLLIGSMRGTLPGIPLGNVTLPLNFDPYLLLTVGTPNTGFLVNTVGILDARGTAKAAFVWPKAFLPQLRGREFHHSFVTFGPHTVNFASNAVSLRLQ